MPEDDTVLFWGLASARQQLESSILAYRVAAPRLGLANYLYAMTPGDRGVLERDLAVGAAKGCGRVVIEDRTPRWVEAELLLRGWAAEDELRLVLPAQEQLRGSPPRHEVRQAADVDAGWSARQVMLRTDHLEEDARHGVPARPVAVTDAIVEHRQAIERHATYLCAVRLGEVAGFVCAWRAPSGQGVIEDVFVAPDHRGHGVAASLLHRAAAWLRADGVGPISIAAEIGDTPGHLYARLGFRPHRTARSLTTKV